MVAFRTTDLGQSEDLVAELHPHWSVLTIPTVLVVAVLGSAVWLDLRFPGMPGAALVLLLLAVAASVLFLAWSVVKRASVHYVITTDRVLTTWGVLSRHGREVPLWRVSDLSYRQTLGQRIVRSGTVSLHTGGMGGVTELANVPNPSQVNHSIWQQVDAGRGRTGWAPERQPTLTVSEQLEKLEELKRRGVISERQYHVQSKALFEER